MLILLITIIIIILAPDVVLTQRNQEGTSPCLVCPWTNPVENEGICNITGVRETCLIFFQPRLVLWAGNDKCCKFGDYYGVKVRDKYECIFRNDYFLFWNYVNGAYCGYDWLFILFYTFGSI
eukprot:TRINITY_DN11141_c0_g1_i1.p1 TRINITY_DN11141_c0_g1~~TRINITY_DN11141_c0_g1_i1.p1  ORF type:complete len:122 (+),score=6.59 TRINITY_DN11141_c0_g1_i1:113-478(+)